MSDTSTAEQKAEAKRQADAAKQTKEAMEQREKAHVEPLIDSAKTDSGHVGKADKEALEHARTDAHPAISAGNEGQLAGSSLTGAEPEKAKPGDEDAKAGAKAAEKEKGGE